MPNHTAYQTDQQLCTHNSDMTKNVGGIGNLSSPRAATCYDQEDIWPLPHREHLIDATRMSDGKLVYIKRVRTGDTESQIASMLSSEPLSTEPRNHCVPILNMFQDNDDAAISYMVMPFLRLIDRPPMETGEEFVDFANQVLEGLVFLREHGVAHRDCEYKNTMMDASAMYPKAFIPSRRYVFLYYYVDFGLSTYFPPDAESRVVVGVVGRDQEVPELSEDVPYDPFKVDVFIIGNMLRNEFQKKYLNFNFLTPLVKSMTQPDPASRPSAQQALAQWQSIRDSLTFWTRRWRLKPRTDPLLTEVVCDAYSLMVTASDVGRQLLGGHQGVWH
ncbi:uncharacterized protein B0H18DRAFT_1123164 [Fomitopsis serialis]|uniref:uncharacterized protein n=1 Tax=Fomitopsis serialis TaxID=139415 RepID=UPI0020077E61|nr:uncharacterized protein B0H18DRAFT_1123164 [Neoantrodia serialis]KAH9918122.1 hypothetical protein B0H18DRAFT_1123164 [Neoantrodia serialis]